MKMNDAITKSVSNAYMKMKAEELTDKQKKHIDKNNNNKIDSHDFKLLRKEDNEVEEGWDDMMKAVKAKSGPQPSGGSGVKKGTRYGGSNQKDEPEVKEKPTAKTKKKPFSEMLQTYKSAGLKSLFEAIEEKSFAEESMQEEVELDELSKSTLGSYVKKASRDAVITRKIGADFERQADAARSPGMKAASTGISNKYKSKSWKRRDGLEKAVDRLTKEEVEELDELSTPTLASYVKEVGHEGEFTKKRVSGLNKAITKIKQNSMKSEDMDIDAINGVKMSTIGEEEMTDDEKNKREDIVKGMKKGMAGFKERYGDRAKSVMYATATKQAMKD